MTAGALEPAKRIETAPEYLPPSDAVLLSPDAMKKPEMKEQKVPNSQHEHDSGRTMTIGFVEQAADSHNTRPKPLSSPSKTQSTLPISMLVTPPSSTTQKSNSGLESLKPPDASHIKHPSFGSRRLAKPASLDVEALCRERQYSGPYSANPLFSRKRSRHEEDDGEISRKRPNTTQTLQSKKEQIEEERNTEVRNESTGDRSAPIDPARDPSATASKLSSKTTALPHIPQILPAPFVSTALPDMRNPAVVRSAPPSTPMTYVRSPMHGHQHNRQSSLSTAPIDPPFPLYHRLPSTSHGAKREKFLHLCADLWDLLENR